MYTWAGVPTCRERACVPIGGGVTYVYSTTRVLPAVVGSYCACIVAYMCIGSIHAVVSNCGASFLILYSTRHALGGRYCTGTGIRGVPLRS